MIVNDGHSALSFDSGREVEYDFATNDINFNQLSQVQIIVFQCISLSDVGDVLF